MNPELRGKIKEYLKENFALKIKTSLTTGHKLSDFAVNPLVLTALASGVFGEQSPLNMAKALLYPRVLGTSISTKFGDKMQTLCTRFLDASGSATPGMDIEFTDKLTSERVYMQLKAGPNTINFGDIQPIVNEMNSAYRLLQQNRVAVMPLFAVGVTYGRPEELSANYRRVQTSTVGAQPNIPIYVGKDLWHRITGNENFYNELVLLFIEIFEEEDYSSLLESDLFQLTEEISAKYFTDGRFDTSKI